MPPTAWEFRYDLNGNLPPQIFIPHVAMRISHPSTPATFDTPMLLDTGATSDYTISRSSAQVVAAHLGDNFEWRTAEISVGPISSLQVAAAYSHSNLQNLPIAHAHSLSQPLNTLRKGSRDANTMSLAFFRQRGCCPAFDPGLGAQARISEYFHTNNDGPVPFFTTDVDLRGGMPTLQHTVTANAENDLHINTAIVGPNGSAISDFCWDTGAWKCTVPQQYMQALGIVGTVVPKISVQTSGGNIVSFLNVPVDTDYDEVLIGASIFTLLRAVIQPGTRGKMSFSVIPPATAKVQINLPFENWPWPPRLWA